MKLLLTLSGLIDRLNTMIGKSVYWLILAAVLVSAGNATIRYAFNESSNAWLEIQWYLFAAVFLLTSGYTLLRNEHIRIDVLTSGLSRRSHAWIDLIGGLLFLLPVTIMIMWLSIPIFVDSFVTGELSSDAGGLIRWPAKILIPLGFGLLALQGISEIIKRIAFLVGAIEHYGAPTAGHHGGAKQ